ARAGESLDEAFCDGIALKIDGDDRDAARCILGRDDRLRTSRENDVHIELNQPGREFGQQLRTAPGIPGLDCEFRIELSDSSGERVDGLRVMRAHAQSTYFGFLDPLLRMRRKRPSCRGGTEGRDEFPPPHSITSWARANRDAGTSRLSALAVLRLTTSSNRVGCCTGSPPGSAPLRMRST